MVSMLLRRCKAGIRIIGVMLGISFALNAYADVGKMLVTVLDATTQRGVGAALVKVTSRDGRVLEVTADATGRVVVDGLKPGLYEVIISLPGYKSNRLPSVRVVDEKTTPVQSKLLTDRQDIEEVVVVGTPSRGDLLSSVGTSFIDREALSSSAGSGSDVLRSLDGLPGLFSEGQYSSFTVRGNGPRDNLILVDGVPFENVVHFGDSFGEQEDLEGGGRYSVFAPNVVGGAEFQPGGWSAAYSGRAGSLLKLDVAEGNPESPTYSARADIAGFEVGYDGPSRVHENTSVLFSARQYNFGRLFDVIGIDDIGTPELTDIIVKTTTQLTPDDKFNILAIYAPEKYKRELDNVLASDEEEPGNYEDVSLIRTKTDNSLLAATWSRLIGDNSEISNQWYFRNYDEFGSTGEAYLDGVENPAEDTIPIRENILQSNRKEKELGWRLDFNTSNRLGQFSSGVHVTQMDLEFDLALSGDWIRYVYEQYDYRPNPDQKYIVLTPLMLNNHYEQREVTYAVYGEQEFSFGDWTVRTGARYDQDPFADENIISPRLGSTWQPNNAMRITTTLGRYLQAPRFNDRAGDASNTGLKNEMVDQVSMGFGYRLADGVDLFVEPYYQRLTRLIVESDGVSRTLGNTGEGESAGVDTAVTRQFDDGWSANIKYSFNDARVRDNSASEYYDADFNRPHSFSIGGVWEANDRWKLSARWKLASGKPSNDFIVHDNVLGDGQPLRYAKEITATNVDRYHSFNSVNFRADYRRTLGRADLVAFIDVINLLGSDNPSESRFNERTGEDVVEGGDMIPLFGFRFEWI